MVDGATDVFRDKVTRPPQPAASGSGGKLSAKKTPQSTKAEACSRGVSTADPEAFLLVRVPVYGLCDSG